MNFIIAQHAQIQRRDQGSGIGLDPSIFEIVGFEMVKLCWTHPGLKLDPLCENCLDLRMQRR